MVVGHNGYRISYWRSSAQWIASNEGFISNTAGTATCLAIVGSTGCAQIDALCGQMSDQRFRTATDHRPTHTRPFRRSRVKVHSQGTLTHFITNIYIYILYIMLINFKNQRLKFHDVVRIFSHFKMGVSMLGITLYVYIVYVNQSHF